jgi:hypothetical protein
LAGWGRAPIDAIIDFLAATSPPGLKPPSFSGEEGFECV